MRFAISKGAGYDVIQLPPTAATLTTAAEAEWVTRTASSDSFMGVGKEDGGEDFGPDVLADTPDSTSFGGDFPFLGEMWERFGDNAEES